MKRIAMFVLLVLFLSAMWIDSAGAVGIGLQIPIGGGSRTYKSVEADDDWSHTGDYKQAGIIGFALDTRMARRGFFNYRLGLGYERINYNPEAEEDHFHSVYYLDNTFGFGIVKTRFLRLWMGPQIRLAYFSFKENYSGTYGSSEYKENGFGIGIGPVIGANFNFGSVVSICLDLGYRFSTHGGTGKATWDYNGITESAETDFTLGQNGHFINISFFFRINDVFERPAQEEEKPGESLW